MRCSWFFHERICLRCFMLFFSSECVYAVYGIFTSKYVYAVLLFFLERMCLRCFWYFHEQICLRCVMFFFLKQMCLRCLWYFHERMCFRCVYAVYGTFTSAYVFAVYVIFSRAYEFTLFMVLSQANMFIMLFFLTPMCLRWVMCSFLLANMFSLFMASCNMSTLLWCFFFFYQRANNIDAVMWNSSQRICSVLLYATFASEYGYAGLWNSFSSYYVRAVMRSYCWCYLCYLRDLGLRDLFLFFVFLVYGLIRLVWQPFQLRLRRWRSKSAQTLWTRR